MPIVVMVKDTMSPKSSRKSGTHRSRKQWPLSMLLHSQNGAPPKITRPKDLGTKPHPPVGTQMESNLKEMEDPKIKCLFCRCLISAAKPRIKMVKTIVHRAPLKKFGSPRLLLVAVQQTEEGIRTATKVAQIRSLSGIRCLPKLSRTLRANPSGALMGRRRRKNCLQSRVMLIGGMVMDMVLLRAPHMILIVAETIVVATIVMEVRMLAETMIIDSIAVITVTHRGISRGGKGIERPEERRGHTALVMMAAGGRGPPREAGGMEGTAAAAGSAPESPGIACTLPLH